MIESTTNYVIESNTVVLDGKKDFLAGCTQASSCDLSSLCLRADPLLKFRTKMHGDERCSVFIPIARAA